MTYKHWLYYNFYEKNKNKIYIYYVCEMKYVLQNILKYIIYYKNKMKYI